MNEHAPEPWNVECLSGGNVEVQDWDGKPVFSTLFNDEDLTNLLRVVACVNVCQGKPIDVLEKDPLQ